MKQGNKIPNFVVVLFAVALAMYIIFSLWESLIDPFTTTIVYPYTLSDSVVGEGFIVREEYPLAAVDGLLDILPEEGEQIGVGQVLARLYSSSSAMALSQSIAQLEKEVAILTHATTVHEGSTPNPDQAVFETLASLQRNTSSGNYSTLESQTHTIKANTLQQVHLYGSPVDSLTLEQRLDTLTAEIITLSSQIARDTSIITAPVSGAYSIMVDGLEWLTPDHLSGLTVEQFYEYDALGTTVSSSTVGKIITGDYWYYVTLLSGDKMAMTEVGDRVSLHFSGDFSQTLTMTVEHLGAEQDGNCVVVLSTNKFLEETTLLRHQRAEIIYRNYSGLRIPKTALRIQESSDTTNPTFGVYVVSAGYAEFKPCTILTEGIDFYVVQPTIEGADALREGNEIIVNARGLYDGKLLEY